MQFDIKAVNGELTEALSHKIDFKTKPIGALGILEKTALKIGQIQQTLSPEIKKPAIVVVAGDHGVTEEGISPYPQEVTFQMVMNFLQGGAAINVFARQHDITLKIADAGVNYDFNGIEGLENVKVRETGTANFAKEMAMSVEECEQALANGSRLVEEAHQRGSNIVGFGEMGIGNTTAAAALLSVYGDHDPSLTVGKGTGLDKAGVQNKAKVIANAIELHGKPATGIETLATYGGLEIATIAGGMLKAAELGMIILVDGFIITSALMAAHSINPNVLDYCVFCHKSNEQGHRLMLEYFKAEPLLDLELRLGEGTGAALALPLVKSAVNFLNEMASFEDAGVSNK
ncbi:nicotinate-nucleotide--dimethylbenzimidazole phosphoribosyltransferase [Puteibacter caeruleilacunae]|nr:nicotinate-nucleotide--dimethylbenzimidazole phosphoribosyltransferase [Puteibacter caeruleilacunae]